MIPTIDADKHNFGKSVELMERAQGNWYRKPRPVFWESLFFGATSPIIPFFSEVGENGSRPTGTSLFNLVTEMESPWVGYSKEVKSALKVTPNDEHFYSFGVLLGYAYIFGIRDLHKYNLILTETHVQAIDAEVVLTDLILPNESVLLPFKDIDFDLCGARTIWPTLNEISKSAQRNVFAGYVDLFANVFKKHEEILSMLNKLNLDAPIRVIVRNTREYSRHLNKSFVLTNLLLEEAVQLERGDIPYFFKKCGDDRLYFLTDPQGAAETVADTGLFLPDIARHAEIPNKLVGNRSTIEQKMIQGLFLMEKWFNVTEAYELTWCGRSLRSQPNEIHNEFTGRTFRKTLRKPTEMT
jgi:hypothetical protein